MEPRPRDADTRGPLARPPARRCAERPPHSTSPAGARHPGQHPSAGNPELAPLRIRPRPRAKSWPAALCAPPWRPTRDVKLEHPGQPEPGPASPASTPYAPPPPPGPAI